MNRIIDIIRCFFGIHNIKDGSTCRLSEVYWNVHDYHKGKGGDGNPSHFHRYVCSKCGKEFEI